MPPLPTVPIKTDDTRIDQMMGTLLRVGVILSAVVVIFGAFLYLRDFGGKVPNYEHFHPGPPELRSISGTLQAALALNGRGVIQLGLLLLVATPVVRVATSIIVFAWQRDVRYIVVTMVVLGVLLYSLVSGYQESIDDQSPLEIDPPAQTTVK